VSFSLGDETMKKEENERKILEFYLSALSSQIAEEEHLDEDTLATLLEGNLNQRQIKLLMKHLAKCGFCRHLTAELIRLDSTLTEGEEISYQSEPTKTSDKIRNLLSEIFQHNVAAIEAFEDKVREEKKERNSEDKEENLNR
jgi:hypothetical protein